MTVSRRRHATPRLTPSQIEGLLGDGDISDDIPPLPDLARLARRMETDAAHWKLLVAFMQQKGVGVFTTLQTACVSFESRTAAEEFARLLRGAMR